MRKSAIFVWGCLLVTLLGFGNPTLANAHAQPARPPNILFILSDDQDAASLQYMPNVQSLLVQQGVSFSNFLVNVSQCCPSRVSILRGQYAHNTGVLHNGSGANGGFEAAFTRGIEQSTVATWLQAAGYETALFGKYLNGYDTPDTSGGLRSYVPPGWTSWAVPVIGGYGEFNYTLNVNGAFVEHGDLPEDYGTDVYAGYAADFIQQAASADKPFFIELAVFAPHGPFTPAPRHADLFPDLIAPQGPSFSEANVSDKPGYIFDLPMISERTLRGINRNYRSRIQSLQAVDEAVANLIDVLASTGQLDNTYIVYTSDNGFHQGQHRQVTGKRTPYEEDIRVPTVIRGPGIPSGTTVDYLAANIDLAPTFADWAGAEPAEFVDGRSLVPLLGDTLPPRDDWRKSFLIAYWNGPLDTAEAPDDTPDTAEAAQESQRLLPDFQGLRTDIYTYIEYVTGEREFYDLRTDPYQLDNAVLTADPDLIALLHTRLAELEGCSAETCRSVEMKPIPP